MANQRATITQDERPNAVPTTLETHPGGGPYHILAASSPADERTRVLKHGDTFAVFDHYGDIKPGGLGEEGLYEFVGEVGGRAKDEFLGNAYAMLFPIGWPEPFGLVMIESLACGTPVVAWRNGSVPEVIQDGVTGFVVDSVDDAVEAVGRVAWLERPKCRKVFEEHFEAARMTRDYVQVYRRLVQGGSERVRSASLAPGPLALSTPSGPDRRRLCRSPAAALLGALPCVE